MKEPLERGDQELPSNSEAERTILGAILLDNAAFEQANQLSPDDFYLDAHRRIFKRISDLHNSGCAIDAITLCEELTRHKELERIGGVVYLSSLTEGLPHRANVQHYVSIVREKAALRAVINAAQGTIARALNCENTEQLITSAQADFAKLAERSLSGKSVPEDILATCLMNSERPPYLVDGLIVRGSVVMLAAPGGAGKSYLAQYIATEIACGGVALGRHCERSKVLVLDRENPAWVIRDRMERIAGGFVPDLTYWTNSAEPQAGPIPEIDSPLLLAYAREHKPLIIVDSLTRFLGDCDENDASDLRKPMAYIRRLATAGATVLIIHHKAKAEGSLYRGSSDLSAACDMVFSMNQDESGFLKLHCHKNRYGAEIFLTIRPDFEAARFEVVSDSATPNSEAIEELARIIRNNPGMTQHQIITCANLGEKRAANLLKANDGKQWRSEHGPRKAMCFYPLTDLRKSAAQVVNNCTSDLRRSAHSLECATAQVGIAEVAN